MIWNKFFYLGTYKSKVHKENYSRIVLDINISILITIQRLLIKRPSQKRPRRPVHECDFGHKTVNWKKDKKLIMERPEPYLVDVLEGWVPPHSIKMELSMIATTDWKVKRRSRSCRKWILVRTTILNKTNSLILTHVRKF